MTTKKKEEYLISREVQVDGNKSDLVVKINFDTEKGTIAITPRITTKHLSFDDIQRQAVLQQIASMTAEAYDFAIDLIQGYLETNRPNDGQLSLLDEIAERTDEDLSDEEPQADGRKTDGVVKKIKVKANG